MTDKLQLLFAAIEKLHGTNPAAAGILIADAIKQAKRLNNRANVAEGQRRWELAQTRGQTVEFTGRMIYTDAYVSKSGNEHEIELYETATGSIIANKITQMQGEEEINRITVAEPGDYLTVMDAFGWSDLARRMARKLKWNTKTEVD